MFRRDRRLGGEREWRKAKQKSFYMKMARSLGSRLSFRRHTSREIIGSNPEALIENFLRHMQFRMPAEIVTNAQTDPVPLLKELATYLSWRAAVHEAVWGLIHSARQLKSCERRPRPSPKLT